MSATVEPERRIRVDPIPAEARGIQGLRAGLFSRIVANVIDLGVVFAVLAALFLGWAGIKLLWQGTGFTWPTPGLVAAIVAFQVLHVAYFAVTWTTSGRTVGDQVMGLRVLGRGGRGLRLGLAFVRAVFCVLVPFGLLWVGISRENRSVQDLVLRTSVIYDWRPHVREPS